MYISIKKESVMITSFILYNKVSRLLSIMLCDVWLSMFGCMMHYRKSCVFVYNFASLHINLFFSQVCDIFSINTLLCLL